MRPRHVLRNWSQVRRRVEGRGPLLILLDLDGTLVPIRSTPDLVRLGPGTRALLTRLRDRYRTRVGVVSGRAVAVLRDLLQVPGLIYVGNHGLEIEGLGLRFVHPGAARAMADLAHAAGALEAALRGIRGVLIERKGLSLSVHWRLVKRGDHAAFRRIVRQVLSRWVQDGAVGATRGKRVIELRPPVAWDKGAAVEWLGRRHGPYAGRLLYVGDDTTDEDAFRAVNRLGGLSVLVGRRPRTTAARWRVNTVGEVRALLRGLSEARCLNRPRR